MPKKKELRTPKTVSREDFNRVLGNLIGSGQRKQEGERTGQKKTQGTIIPPRSKQASE